ncbi:MAG TPA: RNA 2',3'-cyclic phosphodiesterase [Candidatus Moranbacteria bacterium]|nr:RNA 2',3'-cyclic phosphodiesterase [Candidatus Moranbacteria bacterium]
MSTGRVFLAVAVPAQVEKQISRKLVPLRDLPVRWSRPENLHLTLTFAGDLDDGRVLSLLKALPEALEGIEPFDLVLDRITLGPDSERARMIWLTASEPSENLARLRTATDRLVAPQRARHRPLRAHITLGRVIRSRWRKLPEKPTVDIPVRVVLPVTVVTVCESLCLDGRRQYIPLLKEELG